MAGTRLVGRLSRQTAWLRGQDFMLADLTSCCRASSNAHSHCFAPPGGEKKAEILNLDFKPCDAREWWKEGGAVGELSWLATLSTLFLDQCQGKRPLAQRHPSLNKQFACFAPNALYDCGIGARMPTTNQQQHRALSSLTSATGGLGF